ncbi:50S ribosomal protein L31 [Rickettsiales bacterium]|nr:50S ribosomal protein L31 [Rickettsiales bacterium]
MAQANIHPKQHKINVKLTNGESMEILTNWGKEGDILTLDTDPFKHVAWREDKTLIIKATGEKNKKFSKFDSFF